jgi:membrane protein
MIASIGKQLDHFVWGDGLTRYGVLGRFSAGVLRNLWAVLRDIASGQLNLRAMSLVYTTLLSIVPLIAVSFSALKAFGVHEEIEPHLYGFLEPLGPKGVEITDYIIGLVNNVNSNVLGGIGFLFFIYTAISMVQKVEDSFNYVWYVNKARSFTTRLVEYSTVLIVGAAAVGLAVKALVEFSQEKLVVEMHQNVVLAPVFGLTDRLMPYLMTGTIFTSFIGSSSNRQAIYASLAVAISALIWLYLNWIILLVGSQIAFYFQNPAYLQIGRRDPRLSNEMRERVALNIMYLVGKEHRNPVAGVDLRSISRTLHIPSITLAPIALGLETKGLLTTNEKEALLPGKEMSRIRLRDILSVVRQDGETGSHETPHWNDAINEIGKSIHSAVDKTLGDRTLSDLLDETESP